MTSAVKFDISEKFRVCRKERAGREKWRTRKIGHGRINFGDLKSFILMTHDGTLFFGIDGLKEF